jgi:hypothetical protein
MDGGGDLCGCLEAGRVYTERCAGGERKLAECKVVRISLHFIDTGGLMNN